VLVPDHPPVTVESVNPESMIVETGWQLKQVVEFERDVHAAVFDPRDNTLYCVMVNGPTLAIAPDGTRRTVLDQFARHPVIAFEQKALFYTGGGGNLIQAINLDDGMEFSSINCTEDDNDIHTIAFAPPEFVPELLGPDEGLALDIGYNGPMNVFRFNWKTSEAAPIVDNPEVLRCPTGSGPDATIGRETIYLSNTNQLFRLEGSTLIPLPVELQTVSDIAFDPITNDLLVQAGQTVKRVDPAGQKPIRDVLRGIKPDWGNRLRFSADGTDIVLCDVASRRVYFFTREDI